MKKLFSLIVVIVLSICLTGCNNKENEENVVSTDSSEEINSNEVVSDLVGDYMDRVSQRANAKVTLESGDTVRIEISWGSSANEHEEWEIEAKYDDGKLVYDMGGIDHKHFEGDEWVQVNDALGGYFEIKDGIIAWTGSGVESTKTCEFEKVELVSDPKK